MRLVSLVYLFIASTVLAAPPEISAPDKTYGEVGEWVEVQVTSTGKWVKYKAMDAGLKIFPADWLKDQKKIIVSASVAGTYKMLAYTGNEESGADTIITIVFVQKGVNPPGPTPPIPPTPDPPIPAPPVVIEGAWVIVVEETMQRTPAIAQILRDPIWKALPVGGVAMYDKDSADAKKYKYDIMAKQTAIPLPVMMIVDSNGKLLEAKSLPLKDTDVRAFVKKVVGK